MKKILFLMAIIILPNIANAVEYSKEYTIYEWGGNAIQIRTATYAPDEEITTGEKSENICYRTMYEVMEMKLPDKEWEKASFNGIYFREPNFLTEIKNPEKLLPNRGCLCEINHTYNSATKMCEKNETKIEKKLENISTTTEKNIFEGIEMEMRTTSMGQYSQNNKNLQNFLKATNYYSGNIDGIMTIDVLGALRKYQYNHNLIQTGRPDIRTQLVMIEDIKKLLGK